MDLYHQNTSCFNNPKKLNLKFGLRLTINCVNTNGSYFDDPGEIAFSLKYSLGRSKSPSYENKDADENVDRIP